MTITFLLSVLFLTLAIVIPSRASETGDRQEAFRQIVQSYIQAGEQEYEKGFYEQAEKTFLMAQGYREYLTAAERKQLTSLLEKSQTAISKRKSALETFRLVRDMIRQNQLSRAKEQLESIKDNEFLTADERAQIIQVLGHIETQTIKENASSEKPPVQPQSESLQSDIAIEGQQDIPTLYDRSMSLYKAGQFEEARKGFEKVISSGTIPSDMKKYLEYNFISCICCFSFSE